MAVLIFFVVVWVLFALWAYRRKIGGVTAVGGGFVVGCLSLVPVILGGKYLDENYGPKAAQAAHQVTAAPAVQTKGLGVGYDQLIAALGPYAPDLKPAPTTADGRTRLLGRTQGGSAGILDVSGKALSQAVEKATLNIAATRDDQQNEVNVLLLERYLGALFPEWPERVEWALQVIPAGSKESVELAGKRITFKPMTVDGTQMLMFSAETI